MERFYYEQQIKREVKRIHISGCRWNERLKVNTDVSKRLTHTGFIIKDDTRVPHVWCPVNSPHYHTCSDFEFFSKKKHFPSLLEKDLSPLCRDIPPGVLAIFLLLKKSNGKDNEFVGDEDINTVFTGILGDREG